MFYELKAKQALRKFSGRNSVEGQAKLDAICAGLMKKYNIGVSVEPCINEEEPSDNWLNAILEYPDTHEKAKEKAWDELEVALEGRGLAMEWECGGDGEVGPIESYRIMGIC